MSLEYARGVERMFEYKRFNFTAPLATTALTGVAPSSCDCMHLVRIRPKPLSEAQ
jgi:hypothetical protein